MTSRLASRSASVSSEQEAEKEAEKDHDLGLWHVERCVKNGGFDFSGDGHTAVLKESAAGEWCAAIGERHFENGTHGFALRVCYHGNSTCPSAELANGWLVGVGPKNSPLGVGEAVDEEEDLLWARGYPGGYGNHWSVGISNASGNEGRIVLHPSSLLKHGHNTSTFPGRVYHGDVIGIKVEVEHGRISFFVNGTKRKEVVIRPPSSAWVPWVCSCTTKVSFTLLSKEEQRRAWGQADLIKEFENAIAHGAVENGAGERLKQEERMQQLLLSGEGKEEVLELIISGTELPGGWFQGLELDEISIAADTLRLLISSQSPIAPGALKQAGHVGSGHPIVMDDMTALERKASAKDFMRGADRLVQQRRREVDKVASMLQGLSSGEEAYEEWAAVDMSLTLSTQAEQKRLAALLTEAERLLGEARRAREERAKQLAAASTKANETALTLAALHERCINVLFGMYIPLIGHLGDNTAALPTFSAPDAKAAAQAKRRKERGLAVGENEQVPVKVDEATGSMTVTVASLTPSARIFYSIDPATTPNENTSPSVASGRKIVLSSSTRILAFAVAPNMRPSAVVSSPHFVVSCAPPVFVGPSVGAEKIRVQLRSGTTGQVKIYYSFNSRDSTPHELALDGGNPIKEAPHGDGMGRRDGSKPLRNHETGEVCADPHCAGVTNNFDFVDVVTSGHLFAFASKQGLADSPIVKSNMFTIAGK